MNTNLVITIKKKKLKLLIILNTIFKNKRKYIRGTVVSES